MVEFQGFCKEPQMGSLVPGHQLCPWGQKMEGRIYRQIRKEEGGNLGPRWAEEQDPGLDCSMPLSTALSNLHLYP